MTTHACLFNRRGAAVASDTMVTVTGGGSPRRTHPNAVKAFDVPGHSIVVLHAGSANTLGLPVEVLVPMWAASLDSFLPTAEEYADHFTAWLEQYAPAQEGHEESLFRWLIDDVYFDIRRAILDRLERPDYADLDWGHPTIASLITHEVRYEVDRLQTQDQRDRDEASDTAWVAEHADIIQAAFDHVFDDVPHSIDGDQMLLHLIPRLVISAQVGWGIDATFVFAGFGADDVFPGYRAVDVSGLINGRLLSGMLREGRITTGNDSLVVTFGVDDAIHTFIRGYDSRFRTFVGEHLDEILEQVAPDQSDTYLDIQQGLTDHIRDASWREFVSPMLDVVATLPVSALATMAETLVGIEALRQFMNPEQPSVGGPVTVALITRDAGVRWTRACPAA